MADDQNCWHLLTVAVQESFVDVVLAGIVVQHLTTCDPSCDTWRNSKSFTMGPMFGYLHPCCSNHWLWTLGLGICLVSSLSSKLLRWTSSLSGISIADSSCVQTSRCARDLLHVVGFFWCMVDQQLGSSGYPQLQGPCPWTSFYDTSWPCQWRAFRSNHRVGPLSLYCFGAILSIDWKSSQKKNGFLSSPL